MAIISTLITQPLTYILFPLLLSFFCKKQKVRRVLYSFSILLLVLFTNRPLYQWFERQWYQPYERALAAQQTYTYGIVLGGYAYWDWEKNRPEFSEIGDRLFEGIRLYREGRIKKLVLASDGSIIETDPHAKIRGNPEAMRTYLRTIGVKDEDLILETRANNTHENAVFTLAQIGDSLKTQPTMLITSAIHMRRSILAFNQTNLHPDPWITDTQVEPQREFTLIPSINTLARWSALLHEWIGLAAYKFQY